MELWSVHLEYMHLQSVLKIRLQIKHWEIAVDVSDNVALTGAHTCTWTKRIIYWRRYLDNMEQVSWLYETRKSHGAGYSNAHDTADQASCNRQNSRTYQFWIWKHNVYANWLFAATQDMLETAAHLGHVHCWVPSSSPGPNHPHPDAPPPTKRAAAAALLLLSMCPSNQRPVRSVCMPDCPQEKQSLLLYPVSCCFRLRLGSC